MYLSVYVIEYTTDEGYRASLLPWISGYEDAWIIARSLPDGEAQLIVG